MTIQSVLFDLDGVLIDSEGVYSRFWGDIDRRFPTGIPDFAEKIKGSTLNKILTENFPSEEVRDKVKQLLVEQEDSMTYVLFPGVETLLGDLREMGVSTAIVTSSNRPKIRHLLQQQPILGRLTDIIITDEDVTASKPSPEGYLKAAARLGSDPRQCVVVEDSINGLRAGRAAGCRVVGLATTNPFDAVSALADCTYPSAADISLPEILSEKKE